MNPPSCIILRGRAKKKETPHTQQQQQRQHHHQKQQHNSTNAEATYCLSSSYAFSPLHPTHTKSMYSLLIQFHTQTNRERHTHSHTQTQTTHQQCSRPYPPQPAWPTQWYLVILAQVPFISPSPLGCSASITQRDVQRLLSLHCLHTNSNDPRRSATEAENRRNNPTATPTTPHAGRQQKHTATPTNNKEAACHSYAKQNSRLFQAR